MPVRTLHIAAAALLSAALVAPALPAAAAPTPTPTPTAVRTATPAPLRTTPAPTASPARSTAPTPAPVPTATPTPVPAPPKGDALAVAFTGDAVLTLPATDRFRDTVRIRITAARKGPVDLDAVRGRKTVVLGAGLALKRTRAGWARTVVVPSVLLKAGTWTVRARRTDLPRVAARTATPLLVGTGRPVTVTLAPTAGTVYPLKDGALDSADVVVTAADETGTALPIRGEVELTLGKKSRQRTLALGSARIPVTGLTDGTAALTAIIRTPAGRPVVRRASVVLAPTGVGALLLARSADTVQPVPDGLLDTVAFTTSGAASGGSPKPVSGTLTVSSGTTVVQRWPVPTGAATTFTWDGRVGGKVVPGTYTVALTLRGPEGPATTRTRTVLVSNGHLPFRVRDLFTVADGNQQGLAVHDGIFYVGYDNGDGSSRIERYDQYGNRFPLTLSPLAIGHAAELSYSTTTSHLYVANGGSGNPAMVWSIEPMAGDGASALRDTYDLSALGDCAMIAVDDAHNRLLVFSRKPDGATYTISVLSLTEPVDPATGAARVLSTAPITIEGTPQGMEVVGDRLWVYTSFKKRNRIAEYDLSDAVKVASGLPPALLSADLMNSGEGEGLATSGDSNAWMYVGTHSRNRVGVLEPVADE